MINQNPINSRVLIYFSVAFVALAIWMVVPTPPVGFNWDDAWYLMMAEWLSKEPSTQNLVWNLLQYRQYPPLFPATIYLAGAGLENPENAFILNALFLASGTSTAMFWMKAEGCSLLTVILAACLIQLNPIAIYWLPSLFSEHLFIFLTTTTFLLVATRGHQLRTWGIVGLLVGLTVATRSVGWVLVAGFICSLLISSEFRKILYFVGGVIIGLLPIPFLNAGIPIDNSYAFEISEAIRLVGWGFVLTQFEGLVSGWLALWGSDLAALIAAAIVTPGVLIRLRNNSPDAWYVVFYICVILVWPYPDHMSRLLWPLLPMFLLGANTLFISAAASKFDTRTPGTVVLAILFILSVPDGFGRVVSRLALHPPSQYSEISRIPEWMTAEDRKIGLEILDTRNQLLSDMRKIQSMTTTGDCIYSEFPALMAVNTLRVVVPSHWNSIEDMNQFELNCQYYYLVPWALYKFDSADLNRIGKQHTELFRSASPDGSGRESLLAIFLKLNF